MFQYAFRGFLLGTNPGFTLYVAPMMAWSPKKRKPVEEASEEVDLAEGHGLLMSMLADKYSSIKKHRNANAVSINRTAQEAASDPWTAFVQNKWVEDTVESVPHYTEESASCLFWKNILVNEYGRNGKDSAGRVSKVCHIEALLCILARKRCPDLRIMDNNVNVITIESLADETRSGGSTKIDRVIRPGRCIVVNDPLAFDLSFREMQRSHPTYPSNRNPAPHGTKGITEVFDMLGLGPPKDAHSHNVYLHQHRGPASTDPDKIHPDIAYKKCKYPCMYKAHIAAGLLPRPTDGLYFRRYVYSEERAEKSKKIRKH